MLDYEIIRTEEYKQEWISERKKHDVDFDPDIMKLPCVVFYTETESNGYPCVYYMDLDVEFLSYLSERLGA